MTFAPTRQGWMLLLLSGALLASRSWAGEPVLGPKLAVSPGPMGITCIDQLRGLCPQKLEQLFACADVGLQPVGFARGEILHLANTNHACWKAKMANNIWKGKRFCESGDFVNQFKHFQAVRSHVQCGPSYFDGRPCMILEYDEKTPFFGKMRDEVRQVGPGVYLTMVFERCGCHKFLGFIALELQCDDCCTK